MATNPYYDSSGAPSQGSSGSSSTMRAEFDAIEAGMMKLPTLASNGDKHIAVNAGGTALEAKTAAESRTLLDVYSQAEVAAADAVVAATVTTNASNIATNVTNIATNAANIATNVTDIATNAAGIAAVTFPTISSGDAYKALRVNSGETTLEYVGAPELCRTEFISVTSGAVTSTLDASEYGVFAITSITDVTVAFSNFADGMEIKVILSMPGGNTITWPANINWPGGSKPVQSSQNRPDVYVFNKMEAGFLTSGTILGARISTEHY